MKTTEEKNWVEEIGKPTYEVLKKMVDALEEARESDSNEQIESAEQTIQEDPLEIPGHADFQKPTEYFILLGTGGPTTRIIGELSEYGEPETATLEVQDWFKPWTTYRDADEKILLTYARCFYFGE